MTFWHFINCASLTFVPPFILYKSSKLSEFRAYSICIYAGLVYALTQLVKMIVMATFIPYSESTSFDVTQEVFKTIVSVGDIVGVYLVLNWVHGGGQLRMLGVGLGWAAAESFLMKLAPMFLGARGLEFDWQYFQGAVQSNINLLAHICVASIVWLWSRKSRSKQMGQIQLSLLGIFVLLPSVLNYLEHGLLLGGWLVLGVHFAVVVVLALVSQALYNIQTAHQNS